jgi:hypothetical protein
MATGTLLADDRLRGVCPDCAGDYPVTDGRIPAHPVAPGPTVGYATERPACTGAGQSPTSTFRDRFTPEGVAWL